MDAKTLGDKLANVDVVVLVDTLAETLFETDVENSGDTIENGKTEELKNAN